MREVRYSEIKKEFIDLLQQRTLLPIIGAGFTQGCNSHNGRVPSGSGMKDDMIGCLVDCDIADCKTLETMPFSKVAFYYNKFVPEETRKRYLRDRFTDVEICDERTAFLNINWKYLYTLNIDDGIEKNSNYKTVIAPYREMSNGLTDIDKVVFKIHGDAEEMRKYLKGEDFSILDITQYLKSLSENPFILSQLKRDYLHDNVIFIGCSLEDEIDLLSAFGNKSLIHTTDASTSTHLRHHYFLVENNKLSKLKLAELEDYGIDTIVYTDCYPNFYAEFVEYAKEAESIPLDSIDLYSNVSFERLDRQDSSNQDYLFYSKKIYDPSKNKVTFPYYTISRDIAVKLSRLIYEKNIVVLCGTRVSGKTYCLAQLAESIKDRKVYYFDSRTSTQSNTLSLLLQKDRSVLIFDTTVLSRNSIRQLISSYKDLISHDIHVVIAMDRSDRDILSYAEIRQGDFLEVLELKNRLSKEEYDGVNAKLAKIPLLPFEKPKASLLDNLYIAAQKGLAKSGRNPSHIKVTDEYTLALYILLASYEKVDDTQLVGYFLVQESAKVMRSLEHEIEEYYLFPFERSALNNSSYRLLCNAQFWLFAELGQYASSVAHHETITAAYKHLVERTLSLENPRGKFKAFKAVEELIKFDTLNTIFTVPGHGTRGVIQKIYEALSELLSESYQYHHQYAKCLLWTQENSKENVELALKHIQTALNQVNTFISEYSDKGVILQQDHPLYISKAHIVFTICLVYSAICSNEQYSDDDTIKITIEYLSEMVSIPFNDKAIAEINEAKKDRALVNFVKWLSEKADFDNSSLRSYKAKAEKVINCISFKKRADQISDSFFFGNR